MTLTLSLADIASLCASFVSIISVLYLVQIRVARMEAKVDTLWSFQLRRGEVETVLHGLGTKHSPLKLNEGALDVFPRALREEIRQISQERCSTQTELACEIEQRFGERLADEVCLPHGLSWGACLILAMRIAGEKPSPVTAPPEKAAA